MTSFATTAGYCPDCGSILPTLRTTGNVECFNCKKQFRPEIFGSMATEYIIHFNTFDAGKLQLKQDQKAAQIADGPVVERKCSKCGHDKMSYATLQLRSADEGQTVFFTCMKCKYVSPSFFYLPNFLIILVFFFITDTRSPRIHEKQKLLLLIKRVFIINQQKTNALNRVHLSMN